MFMRTPRFEYADPIITNSKKKSMGFRAIDRRRRRAGLTGK
jgi:hypothetical protein